MNNNGIKNKGEKNENNKNAIVYALNMEF